jgi:outer membrane protein
MKQAARNTIILALIALATVSCNQKSPTQQVKQNGLPKSETTTNATTSSVAVVDIDTLADKCNYCKDGQKALEAKKNALTKQFNAKTQSLQNAVINFQKKAQAGQFTSQQEAQKQQAALQKQQQDLQVFQERIERDLAKAQQEYQDKLRKDLNTFLKEYNKDGRFKVIISKSGDNVLYTDPSVDITNDVIEGLNKSFAKEDSYR